MRAHLCTLGNALILAGCASPYARVSHVHPHLTGAPGAGLLATVERTLTKALHEEHAKPLVALADCLTALQTASRELERNSTNATTVRDYDFGIACIFQIVHDAKLDPWSAPLTIPGPAGDFALTHNSICGPSGTPRCMNLRQPTSSMSTGNM